MVFLDAEKEDYEELFALARTKLEPAALVVADNVLSHEETLGAYSRARREDRPSSASRSRSTAGWSYDDPALTTPCATVPVYHERRWSG